MTRNVLETVAKQKHAGVDIVSDGETSKISYATYVKDRYTGFSGDSPRNPPKDLTLFPGVFKKDSQMKVGPHNMLDQCALARLNQKGQGELQKRYL